MTESTTGGEPGAFAGRSINQITVMLGSVPVELARLLEGKSPDDLMQPAQDGRWGIVEIAPHFRDWEAIVADRVRRILTEQTPDLEEHDDSLWAIEHDYRSQDPREAVAGFGALRGALVTTMSTRPPADWSRAARLPKRGIITLHRLLDTVCDHDAKHLMQARDVLT